MTRAAPYMPLWVNDWLAGTMRLSFESQGFYLAVIVRMWDQGGPLPADERWLAGALQCDPRQARRLRDELVAAGKLRIDAGRLINDRVIRELADRDGRSKTATAQGGGWRQSGKHRADIAPTSGGHPGDVGAMSAQTGSKNPAKTTTDGADSRAREPTHTNAENNIESVFSSVGGGVARPTPRAWRNDDLARLVDAAPALRDRLPIAALRDIENRYGPEALTAAFNACNRAFLNGTHVPDPVAYMATVARAKRGQSGRNPAPTGNLPDVLQAFTSRARPSPALRKQVGGGA